MANVTLTFTIPEEKVATAMEGFLKIYPNNEKDENGDAVWTDGEWIKEKIRQIIVRDVRRGLQMAANEAAQISQDDDMVTKS